MRHNRDDVIARTIREFEELDRLVAGLSDEEWALPVPRPESRDPWTVKDSLAHTVYWKANTVRSTRKERKPPEERGFKNVNDLNRLMKRKVMSNKGYGPNSTTNWDWKLKIED